MQGGQVLNSREIVQGGFFDRVISKSKTIIVKEKKIEVVLDIAQAGETLMQTSKT